MAKAPTALNKRGRKVFIDGIKFDSQPEADFYSRFVKDCGYQFEVHPEFILEPATVKSGLKVAGIKYKPDFVIYDDNGKMLHVYDIKNSLGIFGIDASNKLRFRLFLIKSGIAVEAVVVGKRQFKVAAQGPYRSRNEKCPLYKHDFHYDWKEAARID